MAVILAIIGKLGKVSTSSLVTVTHLTVARG